MIELYLSAAEDVRAERAALNRAVAAIPIDVGWRIRQSPTGDVPLEPEALTGADVHLLLLGGDIRAPVGLEWMIAERYQRLPLLFLKQGTARTPAAEQFVRHVALSATWRVYESVADLRRQVLLLLAEKIERLATRLALRPAELTQLHDWRDQLAAEELQADSNRARDVSSSGVILSQERFMPSQGVDLSDLG